MALLRLLLHPRLLSPEHIHRLSNRNSPCLHRGDYLTIWRIWNPHYQARRHSHYNYGDWARSVVYEFGGRGSA